MAIFVQRNSQRLGPYTLAEIRSQLASGALSLNDHVWWTGEEGWIPLVGSPVLKPGFEDPDPTARKKDDGPHGLSPFSVAAVVAGCLFPFAFFTTIPAIVFGHCALYDMKQNKGRTGRGLAYVGLALGYAFTLAWGVVVACYFYYNDEIQAAKYRDEVVHSDVFVPGAPAKTTMTTPAVSPAPAQVSNPAPSATNAAQPQPPAAAK